MKRLVLASAIAASVSVAGCATDPYGYNNTNPQAQRAVTGAAIGGALGAATGAVVGGVSPVEGALVGAVLGGVAGAVIKGKQYYRDTRGYCYYVDQYGNPIYDYNVRC
jgi:hypothetical protein